MKLKKLMSLLMTVAVLLSVLVMPETAVVSADSGITIYVNDSLLNCDIAPFIKDGRTMVPMRKIFEALDAEVLWEGSTQTITATKDATQIILQINNKTLYHNGVAEALDVAPIIVGGSTFVPIRAVSQSLQASVDWFGKTQTVYINSKKTYEEEYNVFLDAYMHFSIPAGYDGWFRIADNDIGENVCAQGYVSDVAVYDNAVYATLENRHTKGETVAVYISEVASTSAETMTKLFKGNNVSIGGEYLGVVDALPTIAMHCVVVFESEKDYDISELTYPDLSLLGQTVTLYDPFGQPLDVPVTRVDEYLEIGWTTGKMVTMYAADGRTIEVPDSEIEAYKRVGWYETRAEAQAVNQQVSGGNSGGSGQGQTTVQGNTGTQVPAINQGETVYIGNTGNKYHTQSCRTLKNGAIPISLGEAKAQGREACKVCH